MHLPFFKSIKPLTRAGALRDAIAGMTLASMNIPQLLGYARIAAMPPVTGLYAGFLPLVAFALLGSSRHLLVAADSATATVLAGSLSNMAAPGGAEYIALAGATALLTAIFLLLARVFRLGFLADFLSYTVLVGFLAGVGVQVAVAMLGDMFGVAVASRNSVMQLVTLARQLSRVQPWTLLISALVVGIILLFKKWKPRWPASLLVVLAAIAASAAFDFSGRGIATIGAVAGGLPPLRFPAIEWRQWLGLFPVALSCFGIIIAQSAATSRAFAQRYNERVDADADLLGLGAANLAAGLTGAFVVNGSPTQTAMAETAGARSQFAQVVFAGVVAVALLFLCRWIQYLPYCVLGGVVFTIAIGLVSFDTLRDIRRESRGEFRLAVVTALAVVLAGVEAGIMLAIVLSLLRHVRHSYRPTSSIVTLDAEGRYWHEPSNPGRQTRPGLVAFRFNADLFYANAQYFCDEVRRLVQGAPVPVRCFVVDASAMTDLDYSAGRAVRALCAELSARRVKIIFARVSEFLRSDLDRHGITPIIGAGNLYSTLHEALNAGTAALART